MSVCGRTRSVDRTEAVSILVFFSATLVFFSAHLKTCSELLILLPELNGCANNFYCVQSICEILITSSRRESLEKKVRKNDKNVQKLTNKNN